ncbi:MAG: transglutaminase TgpA family protein [Actinomycetota bacterium]
MGSEARARLAFGGLLLVTLFAFGELFVSGEFLGPALLGMLVATALTMSCRRLGAGPLLSMWVSLTGLAFYLCIVFESEELLYGLPTPSAAADIIGSITRAAESSSLDFAPVSLRPGYVIMAVAGMWACATLGEVATFRWRRPLLATLPPTSLFAFLMIVGEDSLGGLLALLFVGALLTFWAVESTHRLRSWGRWVGAWSNREEDSDGATGRLARRMGVTAVAAAIVAPLILPALGSGLLTWRNPVAGGPSDGAAGGVGSGGSGGVVNPFVDVRPQLLDQTDAELFRVTAERPSYWRLVSLGDFNGEVWSEGESESESLQGTLVGGEQPPELTEPLRQSYELTGLGGQFAPAAEKPTEVPEGADQFTTDAETRHLTAADNDVSGLRYEVISVEPNLNFTELQDASAGGLGEAEDTYLELPEDTDPRIGELAKRWIDQAGATGDFEPLVALQDRFQASGEFVYSQEVPAPENSEDYLPEFLFDTRTGYCQQYATAFAVMARELNYPTRVSVGFLPGNEDPENPDTYVVRGTHAHTWPEVYFEDYGWVRFEPTPRPLSPELAYTSDPAEVGGGGTLAQLFPDGNPGQVTNPAGNDPLTDGNCPPDVPECSNGLVDPRTLTPTSQNAEDFAWQATFSVILRALLVALVLFLAVVPALKALRVRRRYRRAATPSDRTVAAFSEFLDDASELAEPRAPSESAIVYASRLVRHGRTGEHHSGRLALLYERAEYSAQGTTDEQASEARRLARSLRQSMWGRASWWMRLRRLFSPTALIARRNVTISKPRLRARLANRSLL